MASKSPSHISAAILIAFLLILSWIALLTSAERFQNQEHFSEFYIKDSASLFKANTMELVRTQQGIFSVVVVNHEGVISDYRIHILINDHLVSTLDKISLQDNESIEKQIKFVFPTVGDNQRVDILLEKQGAPFPYRSLHVLIDVALEERPVDNN